MFRTVAIALLGVLSTVLAAEAVLRLLPVSTATMTGYYFDADVLTYPAHHEWTSSTGWDLRNPQRLRSNNLGFVADHDFVADASAVALIGDSQVEAAMLDPALRPAAQLETLLGGSRKVFGLGSPGTALLDYAQRIRFAREHFQVTDFVLWLEAGDARQALCGSGNVHSRCLDPGTLEARVERREKPSRPKRWLRQSALAQYVVGQLMLRPEQLLMSMFARQDPVEPAAGGTRAEPARPQVSNAAQSRSRAVVDAVLARFFVEVPADVAGRLLFVVDGRRGGPAKDMNELDLERQYVITQLRARAVPVIDMEPVYAVNAARSPLHLEVGPYDRHLNALGVQLVMSQIAGKLSR